MSIRVIFVRVLCFHLLNLTKVSSNDLCITGPALHGSPNDPAAVTEPGPQMIPKLDRK